MSIYNEKRLFEREICLIENSSINEENKKIILEYKSYLIATRIGILRTVRYIMILRLISEKFNNKTFSEWTKKDVIEVLEKIEITDYSPHTKREYDKTLKKFFKWHKGKDWEGLECITGNRKIDRKPDILSKDEVLAVIKAARHPRNKAMVALLYEGGFRIGELASIKCKDIEFNNYGGKVKVRGKTGERLVPFVMSESYLKIWMSMHPLPEEDRPLFVGLCTKSYGNSLTYTMYRNIVKRAVTDAGIKKRITPHTFRHSRATHLASTLTESEMCHYLGWELGSDMPKIYVHLSGRDIDNAIYNKVYGLKTEDSKHQNNIKPVECPRCKESCGPTSEYCYRCGMPLKEDKVFGIEKEENSIKKFFYKAAEENIDLIKEFNKALEFIGAFKNDTEMQESLEDERKRRSQAKI